METRYDIWAISRHWAQSWPLIAYLVLNLDGRFYAHVLTPPVLPQVDERNS